VIHAYAAIATPVMIFSVRLAPMMPQSASYKFAMAIVRKSSAGRANCERGLCQARAEAGGAARAHAPWR
jgi:hypothetical protein